MGQTYDGIWSTLMESWKHEGFRDGATAVCECGWRGEGLHGVDEAGDDALYAEHWDEHLMPMVVEVSSGTSWKSWARAASSRVILVGMHMAAGQPELARRMMAALQVDLHERAKVIEHEDRLQDPLDT